MGQALTPARVRAIIDLQKIRAKCRPNSLEYEAADYAIDLVLSHRRTENEFLLRNALKDAWSVLLRQRKRTFNRYAPLEAVDELQGCDTNSPSASLCASPETELLWAEDYGKLKTWGDQQSPRTAGCLEDWRQGFTASESAGARNVSLRTIRSTRKTIRAAATAMLAEAA